MSGKGILGLNKTNYGMFRQRGKKIVKERDQGGLGKHQHGRQDKGIKEAGDVQTGCSSVHFSGRALHLISVVTFHLVVATITHDYNDYKLKLHF